VAYREVGMFEAKEVVRRWLAGDPKKRIARELGLDIKTVRRYVEAAEKTGGRREDELDARSGTADGCGGEPSETPLFEGTGSPPPPACPRARVELCVPKPLPSLDEAAAAALETGGGRPRGGAWAQCEAEREFLVAKLASRHMGRRLRLTKIRKLLRRARGVDVPYSTLHRFATKELGFGKTTPTIPVAEGEPGKELQVDTGWMTILGPDERGQRRRVRAWIFTPVVSRYPVVWPCFRETTETAIEACEAAWEFYGGVFEVLIPDNTKAIVSRADPLAPLFARAFLEYSQARGFFIDPTRVRKPRDKARVEKTVADVRNDCFAGEKLEDVDGALSRALGWSRDEYGMKPHTTTGRRPREHFDSEERPLLKPAPTHRYDVPIWATVKVHPDQHAQVACSLHSVHFDHRGKTLTARADRSTVRLYDGAKLVKTHPRVPRGKRSTDPTDFPPEKAAYAFRDIEYLKTRARELGSAVHDYAVALLDSPLPWTRMRHVYALLRLGRKFGADRLNATCAVLLEETLFNVRRLQKVLELGEAKRSETECRSVIQIAKYLRPGSDYAIPGLVRRETSTKEGENPCPRT
jgi:transposase